jgi:hypothetical protein
MKRSQLISRLLVAWALCVAAVTFAGRANAGTLGVHDPDHSLSSQDVAKLRSVLASQPFDGRVAFTTEHPEQQELARYARSILTESNLVVVAVDPEHRHVRVEYGEGSHVRRAAWPNIDRAGNAAFARGDWEEGVASIFAAAGQSIDASVAPAPVDAPAVAKRPSLFGPVLLLLLVGGAVAAGLYFARRRSLEGSYGPGGGYGPGGYGPMGGPPYGGGGYGPPPGGGLGPLGGGVIGAGLGGLAGYELGKMEGDREARERGGSWDRGGSSGESGGSSGDDQGGGFDAGGGDSSWGDGGGGGGSDGGGGFDGGGGGSDF